MCKIVYNDNLSIKTLNNGTVSEFSCNFYNNYVETLEKLNKSQEWKHQGIGANFRGDTVEYETTSYKNSYYNSLNALNSTDKALFSITINDVSGIFIKDFSSPKDNEAHVIHSNEASYNGSSPNNNGDKLVTAIKRDYFTSHLAVFDLNTSDFTELTDGDCYDFDATFSKTNSSVIYFATKGVGRNSDGDFVKYSPSSICKYNLDFVDVQEVLSSDNYSFVKPKDDENGNLYYIKRPEKAKKKSVFRFLLDILLIPYRLIEAIVMFLEMFTMMFTGKGFTKEKRASDVKTSNKHPGEIFIEGNLINVENEYKNNLKHKDGYVGYAPWSWQLIKLSADGTETVIKNGVIDYDIAKNGDIILTNGKHILKITESGKTEKLAEATMCTKVSVFN